jgi:hypothetical protein
MSIPGIATAIRLPVDLLWPVWICETVAERLGHRTLQMVMRYAHLAAEHQASAVDRLVPGGSRMATKSATGKSGAKSSK